MRNILTRSVKIALFSFALLLLAIPAFSQLSLRRALDFDGDNTADLTVFRPSNNAWYTKKSFDGTFTGTAFGSASEDYMAPGDFDGDGKSDISVWRDTNGGWYRLSSINNTFSGVAFGATGDEPVARDYDGDGKTDIAVVRRSNGAMFWYVLRSLDGGFTAIQFGLSTDFTAPGNYAGADTKFDFAVQRPGATPTSPSTFYILRSNDLGLDVVQWGVSNDLVVPGDYDGDNITDVAVVREGATPASPLNWYIRSSLNGSLLAFTFGNTGTDLNVQGDYDGDGKTDIAVWRDTNGTFYYLKSGSGNAFDFKQWGQSGDYPVASYDTH